MLKKVLECLMVSFMTLTCKVIEVKNELNVIYIDPGHGGVDGGCIGNDGTNEKDINLAISIELKEALINLGYIVEMTRIGDYDLADENSKNRKRDDILKRCELMNKGVLFVSIHANSYPQNTIRGAQTFYNSSEGKILATYIQEKIISILGNTTRLPNKIEEKYILDNISCPGCIVEVGFLSNKSELDLLKKPDYQRLIAYAIAIGINEYLNSKN